MGPIATFKLCTSRADDDGEGSFIFSIYREAATLGFLRGTSSLLWEICDLICIS